MVENESVLEESYELEMGRCAIDEDDEDAKKGPGLVQGLDRRGLPLPAPAFSSAAAAKTFDLFDARRGAEEDLCKCSQAEIFAKIRAILMDKVLGEAGLVKKVEKVDLRAAVHEEALEAQPADLPPIACPEHVVDGDGAGLARVGSTGCPCMMVHACVGSHGVRVSVRIWVVGCHGRPWEVC